MRISESVTVSRLIESQLLEAVVARKPGWQRAYADLVEGYRPYIYQRCLRYLRNPDDAEDVLQEVFLNAYRYADRYQGRAALKTWLTTIADNQCFTHLRRRQRHVQIEHLAAVIEIHEDAQTPSEVVRGDQRRQLVAEVMAQLSPRSREILSLRYWLDLSLEEIAQTLGIGLSASKMRLHRAQRQCREKIDLDALVA
jgi:RNA polymerase sigma-70 factor (ECF subfamily)